ncbi:MAG: hypothetical protein J6Y94_08905 [Bacteriovoracaceae bacterium]|nr:hypothetical protein [Bacteriovoracaceae bacterium]
MLAGKAHQQEGWEAMECELLAKETFSLMEQLREEGAQDAEQAAWLDELKNDPLYQTLNAAASPEAKADPSPSTPDAAAASSPASVAVTIVDRPANTDQPDLGVAPAVVGPMPEAEQNHWVALQPYPSDPGIFYLLETTSSTFCLRAVACANLAAAFDQLPRSAFGQKWNLTDPHHLHFMACQSLAHAEMIVDYLSNKRLPRDQDLIGHLADRDFHWWWEEAGDQVTIYYGGHPTGQNFIKLGPLGDTRIASVRFKHAYPFLQGLFPIAAFKANEEKVILRVADVANQSFQEFKALFLKGGNLTTPGGLSREGQTLGLYFAELAALRRFWLHLQEQLALEE